LPARLARRCACRAAGAAVQHVSIADVHGVLKACEVWVRVCGIGSLNFASPMSCDSFDVASGHAVMAGFP
jgi:hypothetical protein